MCIFHVKTGPKNLKILIMVIRGIGGKFDFEFVTVPATFFARAKGTLYGFGGRISD